jgi:hypothetical protein
VKGVELGARGPFEPSWLYVLMIYYIEKEQSLSTLMSMGFTYLTCEIAHAHLPSKLTAQDKSMNESLWKDLMEGYL